MSYGFHEQSDSPHRPLAPTWGRVTAYVDRGAYVIRDLLLLLRRRASAPRRRSIHSRLLFPPTRYNSHKTAPPTPGHLSPSAFKTTGMEAVAYTPRSPTFTTAAQCRQTESWGLRPVERAAGYDMSPSSYVCCCRCRLPLPPAAAAGPVSP